MNPPPRPRSARSVPPSKGGTTALYVVGMERESFSNDQVHQVLGQLLSGLAVFHAEVCSWLIEVDRGQRLLADGSPDLVQWLADGLVELAATSGDGPPDPIPVTVHADLEALTETGVTGGVAEFEAGPVIASETAQRLACDALVECTVYDHARTLGVGRRTRLVPGWLRRLLWHRDGGCQFPGCNHVDWVHAHHRRHWADGGLTDLANLILLCSYHHRFLHEHGWTIEDGPDGKPVFRRPDRQIYPPPRPALDPRLRELVRST